MPTPGCAETEAVIIKKMAGQNERLHIFFVVAELVVNRKDFCSIVNFKLKICNFKFAMLVVAAVAA
jgi:hypothetical protein